MAHHAIAPPWVLFCPLDAMGINMQLKLAVLCCACAAFWLPPAWAQQSVLAGPADPQAKVPAPAYVSAFAGYQPLRDDALAPWREINDEVARAGGHLGMFGGAHAGHGVKPAPSTKPGVAK
jgi:hypothetical protein